MASNTSALTQQIDVFSKATLPAGDAEDQDTIDFVRIVGLKLIQGKQQSDETRTLLAEIIKDNEVVDKFITYFQGERTKYQAEIAATQTFQTPDGKIVVNKSGSDVPEIYKEQGEKKSKGRNEDNRQKKVEHKQTEKKPYVKPNNNNNAQGDNQNPQNNESEHQPQQEYEKAPLPDLQGKSKCKFFPFCTNQNCQFFHPDQKCPKFPRCRFKENCLFMHQACKFAESCTRSDCFYDHPLKSRKSNNPLMNMMKMMMAANKPHKPKKPQQKPQGQQN